MVRRLWNIQTIGKYLNWDSTKAVKSALLLLKESNLAILERVLNFWLALLQNFRTCLSNFRFLSVEIPRSVTALLSQIKSFLLFVYTFLIYNPKLSDDIYLFQFNIIIFKPTYSKHRVFLKCFQNIL